ncbi:hypothetical protein [Arthrobacter sp.]|uniref:hypothetical protein n=1 Tax=Arthrobacter sp. TaxID=1667 RepID=UPI003A923BDB
MFGSIGQPASGARNDKTARLFLKYLRSEADRPGASRDLERRSARWRTIKRWFTRR